MRKRTWLMLSGMVALVVLVAAGCGSGASGAVVPTGNVSISGIQQTGIWVIGEGKVTVTPDVVVLVLGIESEAVSVIEAQERAQSAMSAVIATLEINSISEKDIQTRHFSIYPVTSWDDDEETQEIIGYRVSNKVSVKVRDTDYAGVVIDAVVEAGGDLTRIDSVSFTVDDPEPLREQAQRLALEDAMTTARFVADTMGVKLGKLTYVHTSGYTPPVSRSMYLENARLADTNIIPGEMDVELAVQATFSID